LGLSCVFHKVSSKGGLLVIFFQLEHTAARLRNTLSLRPLCLFPVLRLTEAAASCAQNKSA
jgi:hypothetical protein